MSKLRKNFSAQSIFGKKYYIPNENDDILYYILHQTINKAIEAKLIQSHSKGYLDLSHIGLNSIPDEIFRLNYSVDGFKWWLNVDFTKVDLSYNNLNEKTFKGLKYIPHVKILYLISNRFNMIPSCIFYLQGLIFLDLSNNNIFYIDDHFCWNLTILRTLILSKNRIDKIPSSIRYMRNLEDLNLSNNELTKIPKELSFLENLKILNISYNKLRVIESNIFNNLFDLEELYCNNNILTNISNLNNYTVFDSIVNLKILDISYNNYQDYMVFRQLSNLEKINISNNKLRNIYGLNLCAKLYEIDCSNNNIKEFPYDFLSLKNLEKLNIQFNELNNLPAFICLMDNLSDLNIKGNPMREAPDLKIRTTAQIKEFFQSKISEKDIQYMPDNLKKQYFRRITNNYDESNSDKYKYIGTSIFSFLKNGSHLEMSNIEIKEIPFSIIKNNIPENFITSINLSGNLIEKGLERFKEIMYLLRRVKSLNFSRNKIKFFPILLLNLPYLQELYLSKNLMSVFPAHSVYPIYSNNITQSLLILDLSYNQLDEFPVIIEFFKNLRFLDLSDNNISNIDCLLHMRLEFLEEFFLDNNKIKKIPQNILFRAIPNIHTFTASNNYLSDIPTDLFLLLFLEIINFTGNFIQKIPYDYLLNADDLKNYLKKYHVYSEEQKFFESEQEYKKRNDYIFLKERKRMNKTSPLYPSHRNNIYFNYKLSNTINNKRYTNYNNMSFINKNNNNNLSYNNDLIKNKFMDEINESSEFIRNLSDINGEIYKLQSIKNNTKLDPYEKANLRKKFIKLIQERADLYK